MIQNSISDSQLETIAANVERRDLDLAVAQIQPSLISDLSKVSFLHVRGMAKFWSKDSGGAIGQLLSDIFSGLAGLGNEIHLVSHGTKDHTSLYWGTSEQNFINRLGSTLSASFPGVILSSGINTQVARQLFDGKYFTNLGIISGIPASQIFALFNYSSKHNKEEHNSSISASVDRLYRGMAHEHWGLWVAAKPILINAIYDLYYQSLDQLTHISSISKRQIQSLTQELQQIDPITQRGSTESLSGEIFNKRAEYLVRQIEKQLKRIELMKILGAWDTAVFYFSPSPIVFSKLAALMLSVFSGQAENVQPIRAHNTLIAPSGTIANFRTQISSAELATYFQFPINEIPGFRIAPYARFDTDLPLNNIAPDLKLGKIIDINRLTDIELSIPSPHLSKHALISGVTGSGKTTTIKNIIKGIRLPFLVVEPAKSEYRNIVKEMNTNTNQNFEVRIYTVGDESVSPFRLNPFEFLVIDEDSKVHVQTHVDYLSSVFLASFVLYAPMPYVLDMALHEIYIDKGWDFATGLNLRLETVNYKDIAKFSVFPTLDDLYSKITEVVDRLGYEARLEMDIKAGLKARIGSLMLGSKGSMLNCLHGISSEDLFSNSTIIELDRIGNDEEKAFVIGCLLTKLYEYRKLKASTARELEHVTIIEEAHRLLSNPAKGNSHETSNIRNQAIETFTNMLSEIRAYGEGVIIAEQIPSKLAPDAIKNTNLKITHRLVAKDDRELVGDTMNMTDDQKDFLANLPPGIAAIYADFADHPYLIAIENRRGSKVFTTDEEVRTSMEKIGQTLIYDPVPGYLSIVENNPGDLDLSVFELANSIIKKREFQIIWSKITLSALVDDNVDSVSKIFSSLLDCILRFSFNKYIAEKLIRATIVLAVEHSGKSKGDKLKWGYAKQLELLTSFRGLLLSLLSKDGSDAQGYLRDFRKRYFELALVEVGPFLGCEKCNSRCYLRYDVAALIDRENVSQFIDEVKSAKDAGELEVEFRDHIAKNMGSIFSLIEKEAARDLLICFFSQIAYQAEFSEISQKSTITIVENILKDPLKS